MSARRKARKRAVDFLYEAEIKKINAQELLETRPPDELSEGEYALHLVQGVGENQRTIDELISTYAQGWDMDRLPALDRNILRVAIYELLYEKDLDDQIAINEAVEIADDISTVDSSSYINGVLGRISALKESLI